MEQTDRIQVINASYRLRDAEKEKARRLWWKSKSAGQEPFDVVLIRTDVG